MEGKKILEEDPEHYHGHSSLGYHMYNSLYAAKNKEIILTPEAKKERIQEAHKYFKRAQELRPEQVTNYYREGMLFKAIENKSEQALPLFSKASITGTIIPWNKRNTDIRKERISLSRYITWLLVKAKEKNTPLPYKI